MEEVAEDWTRVLAIVAHPDDLEHAAGPGGWNVDGLEESLYAAVRIGDDTDAIAAIAGALLGARWGASAIPQAWRDDVNGWPGLTADGLSGLALRTAR